MYTSSDLTKLNGDEFLRGKAVVAMVYALLTNLNGSNVSLLNNLVASNVMSSDDAIAFAQAIADIGKY